MKKSTSCSAPARRSLSTRRSFTRRLVGKGGFFTPRVLLALLLCAAACSLVTGTLAAFFHSETPNVSQRTLTFAERVAYQRAIEDVYWRHRIWPRNRGERPDPKPSLDAIMSRADLEKKVTDYLRKSQALEDYWQRPITAEQLQAEMDRMAKNTKQPELLRELFEALGNDPFVIAECLARPALAERLLTNWYSYDQRIHGELRRRAEADLQAHPTVDGMKQTSGGYSEIELVKSDRSHEQATRAVQPGVKLNASEWDETVQKLAGVLNAKNSRTPKTQIRTGVASPLQEDETRYYAAAVTEKTEDHLKLVTIAWIKEPITSWLARAEDKARDAVAAMDRDYTLPKTLGGAGCIDDTWTATAGPPDGRHSHTAVWTGTEMIIWGGLVGNFSRLNTGGRYTPSTDSWTTMTAANAPAPRDSHTAVWTGSEMIVWGGFENGFLSNTGGRYNVGTNSWIATSTANAPTARYSHTAVSTGAEMIIWGGFDGNLSNTGGRYDPNTDSWMNISTTNAPEGRESHTAVWTGTEMIIWGGEGEFARLNTGGRYSPSTDTWIATGMANVPSARIDHTAIWTGGEMIVWGGMNSGGFFLNIGGKYNPDTDSWTATSTANVPSARIRHTAVWTSSEMIVWGGVDESLAYTNTGGRYSPDSDTWAATGTVNAPDGRELHTAVWTGSEMIVWGSEASVNTGGRYNPDTDSWIATGTNNAPSSRELHTAVWTGSEMIIWGGYDGSFLNTGGRYSPSMDSWTATSTANAPDGRYLHIAVWTGPEMIVWGGSNGASDLNTGGRYNPGTDSWTVTSITGAPSGRGGHTAVWTGSEMIVWGGYDGNTGLNTGGRYDPGTNTWTPTSTSNAPTGRYAHTAVWSSSEMIIWGGNALNTGGRYNPGTNTWTATSTTNAPTGRDAHTAVWTGSEMIVWGGYFYDQGNHYLNSGGTYDGGKDSWTGTNTINAPTGREYHTAVWTGGEMVVWGGANYPNDFNSGGRYCAQSGPTPTPTPTPTASPTPGAITLSAHGRRVQGRHTVDLSWNGANAASIDIYRDGVAVATVPNTGAYKDFIGVRGGNARYVYKVCEAGTQNCSNQVTVRFGGPPL